MRAFISYSTEDKIDAAEVAGAAKVLRFEAFVAHDDIMVAESWRDRILVELSSCHLFIPLISEHFKASDWCAMECGFILGRPEVAIVPLSLDGTPPYGFLSKYQCCFLPPRPEKKWRPRGILPALRAGLLLKNFDLVFDTMIEGLLRIKSPRSLRELVRELVAYAPRYQTAHVEKLVDTLEAQTKLCRRDEKIMRGIRMLHQSIVVSDYLSGRLAKIYAPLEWERPNQTPQPVTRGATPPAAQ